MALELSSYIPIQRTWVWITSKIAIPVYTFYGKVVGNRLMTKMAVEFFTYMPIQCTWVWETPKSRYFCTYFLWESCWQSVGDQNGARVFPVHACTVYVSVDNVKKSQFRYILSMGRLLAIGWWPKWRSSFLGTCLYSVRECGKRQKSGISVYVFYEKVAGSWSNTKMAPEFFPYMPIQRTWVWEMSKNRRFGIYFLWKSCWQSVKDQNGGPVFPSMPIQRTWVCVTPKNSHFCIYFLGKVADSR